MDHNVINQMNLLAQNPTGLGGPIQGPGLGPFGLTGYGTGDQTKALTDITKVMSSIIGVMTIAAGLWFLIHILVAGIRWLGSEGDKTKLQEAQNRLTNAFIGLIIVAVGWSILALAGKFTGIEFLIPNPGALINQLRIQ